MMESASFSSEARRRAESLSSTSGRTERLSSNSEEPSNKRVESMSLHPGLQSHRDSVTIQGSLGRRESESSHAGNRDSVSSSYSGHRDSISSYSGTIPGHRGSFSLRGEDLNEGSFSRSRSKSGGNKRRRSRSGIESSYSPESSPLYSRTSRSERSELYSGRRRHDHELYPGSTRAHQVPELYSGSNMSELFSAICRPEPVPSDPFPGPGSATRLEQFGDLYSLTKSRSGNLCSDDLTLDPSPGSRRSSVLAEGEERTPNDM